MLQHFPHRGINGLWHAVYRTPGCNSLTSAAESSSEDEIKRECRRLNDEQARRERLVQTDMALAGVRR